MKCPTCKKEVDAIRSAVRDGQYISPRCDRCLSSFHGFADSARKFARDWDKRENARSLIQPWEEEFPKEYGYDKAREAGWTDEQIRRLT